MISAVLERFAACGSARAVWLWLREHGLKWPLTPSAYLRGSGRRAQVQAVWLTQQNTAAIIDHDRSIFH